MKTQIKLFFVNLFGIVRKGQVWEHKIFKNDPFRPTVTQYYRVINVKKGYVHYNHVSIDGDIIGFGYSDKIGWFLCNSNCIKL